MNYLANQLVDENSPRITLFFFYQQFITRHAVADCGSYFVATYKRGKLT